MTNCSLCTREIPDTEAQLCELCGQDGFGNCCIGTADHNCAETYRKFEGL